MKKFFLLLSIISFTWCGTAFAIPFTMVNFGSDDVSSIMANIVDNGENRVTISVDVIGSLADITGVFFDLNLDWSNPLTPSLSFDSFSPAGILPRPFVSHDNVTMAPNLSNMGGSIPPFDVGVGIGETGLNGDDDFPNVSFDVFYDDLVGLDLDASLFTRLGVRLHSVEVENSGESIGSDDSRDGSAKYVGTPGTSAVPEPASVFLLGVGLVGLAGFGRKKFLKK